MFRTLVPAALLVAGATAIAAAAEKAPAAKLAAGDLLPKISGEYLTGRDAVLPEVASGKVALVLMGFTYDSRFPVEKYAKELRAAFPSEPGFTFYEVPVIGGMGRLAKWFIDSGMRKGTPRELHENVITVYGGVDRLKTAMGFTKAGEKDVYLTLLDRAGRVRWMHHGQWDEAAFETLKTEINAALAAQ